MDTYLDVLPQFWIFKIEIGDLGFGIVIRYWDLDSGFWILDSDSGYEFGIWSGCGIDPLIKFDPVQD